MEKIRKRVREAGGEGKIKTGADDRVYIRRRSLRGSFTVEATFLYPMIILLIAFMLSLSINWYENVRRASEDTEELRELDTRTEFLENTGRFF